MQTNLAARFSRVSRFPGMIEDIDKTEIVFLQTLILSMCILILLG